MTHPLPGRRPSRTLVGVLAAAALTGLASLPAVAVAAEPDLGIGPLAPITDAQPGSGVDVPFSVLNKGTEEVGKTWVTYSVTSGLGTADSYGNCTYSTQSSADEEPEKTLAVCAVEQPLKPGVVYVPEKPIGLKALDNALYDKVRMTVEATDPGTGDGGGTDPVPGTGAPLKLVEKAPATDADRASHSEGSSTADVTAVNTADFALTGAQLDGKVGDEVTASVKFLNKGPAWVYRELGQGAATVDVRIPSGTSVVKAHDYCSPVTKTHYTCGTSQSWVDEAGGETYPFVLRIDKAVEGATGKVSFTGADRPFDKNAANDTAEIVIDAGTGTTTGGSSTGGSTTGGSSTEGSSTTGGTDTSGGSASGGSTAGGSTAGGSDPKTMTSGNLAATGSDSTVPMVGAAAAALIAGGGIFYAVRRRAAAGN
ncbi:LPXTG cell wall anchor domain-containing protein [Streptomyces sp. NBC_01166]|uniref:LAETG motif-containing sortase-dependent surface protein n=1 Tax=Streptomyces sp. NBC_01166 TaxID=2903755 RepID=UPI00386993BD|nr:LPXTG cell wall anchor domain-containing protein [Streptomyces sp. NBC_01166]